MNMFKNPILLDTSSSYIHEIIIIISNDLHYQNTFLVNMSDHLEVSKVEYYCKHNL